MGRAENGLGIITPPVEDELVSARRPKAVLFEKPLAPEPVEFIDGLQDGGSVADGG